MGLVSFFFHALGDTKQKKPTPVDRGPPLHVNRVLVCIVLDHRGVNFLTIVRTNRVAVTLPK